VKLAAEELDSFIVIPDDQGHMEERLTQLTLPFHLVALLRPGTGWGGAHNLVG
jgi:hypothetical protein